MNAKFSIGIVIAIVLQVSGFVWWIAQQSQTIDTLKGEVAELTAKSQIEKEVSLTKDVEQLRKEMDQIKVDILESLTSIDDARLSEDNRLAEYTDERVNNLGDYVDGKLQTITQNIIAEFNKHEEWWEINDQDIEDIYLHIDVQIQALEEKLDELGEVH